MGTPSQGKASLRLLALGEDVVSPRPPGLGPPLQPLPHISSSCLPRSTSVSPTLLATPPTIVHPCRHSREVGKRGVGQQGRRGVLAWGRSPLSSRVLARPPAPPLQSAPPFHPWSPAMRLARSRTLHPSKCPVVSHIAELALTECLAPIFRPCLSLALPFSLAFARLPSVPSRPLCLGYPLPRPPTIQRIRKPLVEHHR